MHRPKAAPEATPRTGSAAIAKRRLVAALAADRRTPAAPAETQLLAQLLAAPALPKRR